MSENDNQYNPPFAILPTDVNLSMTEAGFSDLLSTWTEMPYLEVDTSTYLATPGAGTVDVTDDWSVTLTVLYFGDNQAVADAFEMVTFALDDGPKILTDVGAIVLDNGGSADDVVFEIEAMLPPETEGGPALIVGLGEADIAGSSFFLWPEELGQNPEATEILDFVYVDNFEPGETPLPGEGEQPIVTNPVPGEGELPIVTNPVPGEGELPIVTNPVPGEGELPIVDNPVPGEGELPIVTNPVPGEGELPIVTNPVPGDDDTDDNMQPIVYDIVGADITGYGVPAGVPVLMPINGLHTLLFDGDPTGVGAMHSVTFQPVEEVNGKYYHTAEADDFVYSGSIEGKSVAEYFHGDPGVGNLEANALETVEVTEGEPDPLPVFYMNPEFLEYGDALRDELGGVVDPGNYAVDITFGENPVPGVDDIIGGLLKPVTLIGTEWHPTVDASDIILDVVGADNLVFKISDYPNDPIGELAPPTVVVDGEGPVVGPPTNGDDVDDSEEPDPIPVYDLSSVPVDFLVDDAGEPFPYGYYAVDFMYGESGDIIGGMLKPVTLIGTEWHPTVDGMDVVLGSFGAFDIEQSLTESVGVLAPPPVVNDSEEPDPILVFDLSPVPVDYMVDYYGDPISYGNYAVLISHGQDDSITQIVLKPVTYDPIDEEWYPTVGAMDVYLGSAEADAIYSELDLNDVLGELAPPPVVVDGDDVDGYVQHHALPVHYFDDDYTGGYVSDNGIPWLEGNYAVDIISGENGAVIGGMLKPVTLIGAEWHPTVQAEDLVIGPDVATAISNDLTNDPQAWEPLGVLAPPSEGGVVEESSWTPLGTIDGEYIFGNGTDSQSSDEFSIQIQPTGPVLNFYYVGDGADEGAAITDIAPDAPTSGYYVRYWSGFPEAEAVYFQPVKEDGGVGSGIWIEDTEKSIVEVTPELLNPTFDLQDLIDKTNTMLHDISNARVGELPMGPPVNKVLITGNEGSPIDDFAAIPDEKEDWWVEEGDHDHRPFSSPSGSDGPSDSSPVNMYDHYGIEEGNFGAYLDFHINGTGNTDELVGFFTGNDPFFGDLNTVVASNGGYVFGVDDADAGTSVTGTPGTDAYLIDDYHVKASAGSDIFIMGMGSSGGNTNGAIQNLTYDQTGAADYDLSDPNADMDVLYVAWLPDKVRVDANWGSVTHGSGGTGSDVYIDYFSGIEVFSLTDFDDYFAGGGPVDINWIDPGSGNDEFFGVDSVFTVLDYSSDSNDFGVYIYNGDISSGIPIPGETNLSVENGDQFDGAVINDYGQVSVYSNVDYFVGSADDDVFIGGSGSDQFNAMWSDDTADIFDGGAGDDTLIIEDGITNRGIFGDLYDMWGEGVSVNDIDLDSIEVIKGQPTDTGFVYNVTGTNVSTTQDIDVELTDVERIDIREYSDSEIAQDGSEHRELYVVDSYELLEGGQGDLGDMYYVTSLGHSPFDIDDGEDTTYQILSEDNLNDANIYYSGHHTDFNRQLDVSGWTASGTAAAIYTATNLHQTWQGHESIFFAWYDPDGEGGVDAYEIAVKRDDDDGIWRIANKAFDTFSNITLSAEDASTLNAMSHSIQENDSPGFVENDTLRVYLGAAYQDITNVINSGETGYVGDWDFSQDFTTSRSTYYIEIPNGTTATTQQVKVEYNNDTSNWDLRANEEILVNIPAFSVIAADDPATTVDERASVVAGSGAAELISAGDGADTMLGGGGADTYRIGDGDASEDLAPDAFGVVGDVINEIGGDLSSTLGDSVNFTNLESIDNIFFDRTQIRFEKAEATLTITSNTIKEDGLISKDVVHIFDHFNEDLPFRQVEQLLLDEGWGLDQIWNLVADGQGGVNRDVLVGGIGNDTLVSGGGVDVMQGGAGEDIFVLGSSDVALADIDTAHGDVTMIRDFVSDDDSIDLRSLNIEDVSNVETAQDSAGRTYLVSDTHVLAELMLTSDTILADDDVVLPPIV